MPTYKKMPTAGELILSIDNVLKKEYDKNTRLLFFFGLLKILEKDAENFKSAILEYIEKLL